MDPVKQKGIAEELDRCPDDHDVNTKIFANADSDIYLFPPRTVAEVSKKLEDIRTRYAF